MNYIANRIKKDLQEYLGGSEELNVAESQLIDYLSKNLAELHRTVKLSPDRIERRIQERLDRKNNRGEGIALGMTYAKADIATTLRKETAIKFSNGARFSPLVDCPVTEAKLLVRIDENGVFEYDDLGKKHLIPSPLQSSVDGRIFLGLQLGACKKIRLYLKPSEEEVSGAPVDFSLATFWSQGKPVSSEFYQFQFPAEDHRPGPESLLLYQMEKGAAQHLDNQIVTVELEEYTEAKTTLSEEEFPAVQLNENLLSQLTHWLEIRLPAGLALGSSEIEVYINPVPVLNRVHKKWSSNPLRNKEDQTLVLEQEDGLPFLAINDVRGDASESYRELTFRPFFSAPGGVYELCRTLYGTNENDKFLELECMLGRCHQIIAELGLEVPGSHKYNDQVEFDNTMMRRLRECYTLGKESRYTPVYYLRIRTRCENEQLRVEWWLKDINSLTPHKGDITEIEGQGLYLVWI